MKRTARMYPALLLGLLFLLLSGCDWLLNFDTEDPTIAIDTPTNYFSWVTTDATLDISGTATDDGDIKSVKVTVNGENSTTASGTGEWSVTDLPLEMGENTVVCEAKDKGGNTASVTMMVTRNTDVEFTGVPYFSMNNFFAMQTGYPIVRQSLGSSSKAITAVKLYRLNDDYTLATEIGQLYDDGDLYYHHDEILGDGVYSGYLPIYEESVGTPYYRVVATTEAKVENYSPIYMVNVYEAPTQEEVDNIITNHTGLADVLNETDATSLAEGADELQDWFLEQPGVASVSKYDTYLMVNYSNGIKGGVIFSDTDEDGYITTLGGANIRSPRDLPPIPLPKQTRGINSYQTANPKFSWNMSKEEDEDAVQDKDVFIWQPLQSVLPASMTYHPELNDIFEESDLGLNVVNLANAECTIASLSNITEYGTVIVMTHGIGGEHLLTSELMTSDNVWDYLPQILNDEIGYWENIHYSTTNGFQNKGTVYSVRSAWIAGLGGTFPNSIIYNGSCEGSKTGNLYAAFSGKGAKAYLAFSKIVTARFAKERCIDYFEKMAVDLDDNGDAFTAGMTDPYRNPAATFTMSGNDDLHYSYDLINGDFEFGNINGWTRSGDGRVITQLAGIMPTGGNFMGIISTGLGYTDASGSIAQSFLVPESVEELTINWNFISEEFMEWVGSQYQDYLQVIIKDEEDYEYVLFHETIDSFVGYGLQDVSPPVYFDHGDCYGTDWRLSTYDITEFQNQVVRLIIRIGDVGDSAYDSACLLDDISID